MVCFPNSITTKGSVGQIKSDLPMDLKKTRNKKSTLAGSIKQVLFTRHRPYKVLLLPHCIYPQVLVYQKLISCSSRTHSVGLKKGILIFRPETAMEISNSGKIIIRPPHLTNYSHPSAGVVRFKDPMAGIGLL